MLPCSCFSQLQHLPNPARCSALHVCLPADLLEFLKGKGPHLTGTPIASEAVPCAGVWDILGSTPSCLVSGPQLENLSVSGLLQLHKGDNERT